MAINPKENNLQTDINAVSTDVIHELFIACRKGGIYSCDHPLVHKAINQPFMTLQRVFAFKKYFALHFTRGRLYVNNIQMKDASHIDYFRERMQELELRSLLISDAVTTDDLREMVRRITLRLNQLDAEFHLAEFLHKRNIETILVNDPLGEKIFDTGIHYRAHVNEDLSVRRIVANFFSGETDLAMNLLNADFEDTRALAEATGIDYHKEIVSYILPERFSQLRQSELIDVAERIIGSDESIADKLRDFGRLLKSLDFHPQREVLLRELQDRFNGGREIMNSISAALAVATPMVNDQNNTIDIYIKNIFSDEFTPADLDEYREAFARLIRTRRIGKAATVAEQTVDYLAHSDSRYRHRAVVLLEKMVKTALSIGEVEFLDVLLRHNQHLFTQGRETFEFAEISTLLMQSLLSVRRYEPVAAFLKVISAGRGESGGIVTYDSVVVKKIFDSLNQADLIGRLIRELQLPDNPQLIQIRTILSSIRSEEVALQLAEIVTHPDRSVRQRCLKLLSELGRPAVSVFSEILREEPNFYRMEARHELPDKQWYLVRNAIFVLGNLGDSAACHALRLRISDPDVRIRREIISALEKIGGDDAVDLLMILCDDLDSSIREAAIITLGLTRRSDLVPFFIDLLPRQKGEVGRIVSALGQTGSVEAGDYLTRLLNDPQALKSLASGNATVDDIRKAVIGALEKIGDDESRAAIEVHRNGQAGSGDSTLSKTARLFLNKIQNRL